MWLVSHADIVTCHRVGYGNGGMAHKRRIHVMQPTQIRSDRVAWKSAKSAHRKGLP